MGRISIGAVAVVILDGMVLLTKRRDYPVWVLPGGAIEFGESPDVAAARETLEETGVEVEIVRFVGVYTRVSAADRTDHGLTYLARVCGGELARETNETADAGYFPPDQLPKDTVWWHRRRISDALSGCAGLTIYQHSEYPGNATTREELEEWMRTGAISVEAVVQDVTAPEANYTELVCVEGAKAQQ